MHVLKKYVCNRGAFANKGYVATVMNLYITVISRWWFGLVVTSLVVSTRLAFVEPG